MRLAVRVRLPGVQVRGRCPGSASRTRAAAAAALLPAASPAQLLDLIDLGPAAMRAMQAYLPRFEFLLDDLADVDGPQLRDRKLTPSALITLLLLKTAPGNPRVPAELRPWASQLRAVLDQPGGGEAFTALLTYVELVSEAPASELRDLATSPPRSARTQRRRT